MNDFVSYLKRKQKIWKGKVSSVWFSFCIFNAKVNPISLFEAKAYFSRKMIPNKDCKPMLLGQVCIIIRIMIWSNCSWDLKRDAHLSSFGIFAFQLGLILLKTLRLCLVPGKFEGKCEGKKIQMKSRRKEKMKENKKID